MSIINKNIKIFVIFIMCFSFALTQTKTDARMLGMGGAYSTVANGYRTVGFNPANLAFNRSYDVNIMGFNHSFLNNVFSIETFNKFNGANLEDVNAEKYFDKNDLFKLTKKEGINLKMNSQFAVPGLNLSKGIFAFTSDFVFLSNFGIPEAMLDLFFNGISADIDPEISDIGSDFVFDFRQDVIGVNEFAFSMGIPYDKFGLGLTFKYLQGLFYLGIDYDSSFATLRVDPDQVSGSGRILLRQAIGGGGIGLDLGFVTKRSDKGWKFGFSMINLLSSIEWNKPNITRNLFGDSIESSMPFRQNEYFLYQYQIENVTAESFLGEDGDLDSLFQTDSYPVVEDPDFGLVRSDTLATINLDERDIKDFTIKYPAFFTIGTSKLIDGQALISMDMTTGFSNSFNGYTNWKFALGTEIFRFKNVIYRLGYTFGGNNFSDLSYGMGYVIGPFFGSKIEFDIAFSLKNSIFINRAQGLDFALGIIWSR